MKAWASYLTSLCLCRYYQTQPQYSMGESSSLTRLLRHFSDRKLWMHSNCSITDGSLLLPFYQDWFSQGLGPDLRVEKGRESASWLRHYLFPVPGPSFREFLPQGPLYLPAPLHSTPASAAAIPGCSTPPALLSTALAPNLQTHPGMGPTTETGGEGSSCRVRLLDLLP